jgi:hypothetical protein
MNSVGPAPSPARSSISPRSRVHAYMPSRLDAQRRREEGTTTLLYAELVAPSLAQQNIMNAGGRTGTNRNTGSTRRSSSKAAGAIFDNVILLNQKPLEVTLVYFGLPRGAICICHTKTDYKAFSQQ